MQELLDWLLNHVSLISAVASLVMVFVWLFYTNLFYRDFRGRHHPRIMIHQAPDEQLDSMCFVVNMSPQLVNIVGVFVAHPGSQTLVEVTEYRHFSTEHYGGREMKSILKQGPLGTGEFLHLGTFAELLSRLEESAGSENTGEQGNSTPPRLEIRVALYHGSATLPAGGRRIFRVLETPKGKRIRPESFQTLQMSSRKEGKRVLNWLEAALK